MSKFSDYEYRKQPGFDMNTFEGANQAIPMKTLVIHCFDPRAAEIPQAVAEHFGDEVYLGENILDKSGNRVGHTRTLFAETNAGGRAAFALESVAAMDHIFSVQNVVTGARVQSQILTKLGTRRTSRSPRISALRLKTSY
jgi:carbonic anhydrase